MAAIYLTSVSERAGRTMLCCGLGKIWQNDGKAVGYLKLFTAGSNPQEDEDLAFVQLTLGLKEPVESLAATVNPQDIAGSVKSAYRRIEAGKDLVLVEGLPPEASRGILDALDARALILHDYSTPLASSLAASQKLKERVAGIVSNKIPRSHLARFKTQASAETSRAGLTFLGAIPEERLLMTLSIADLAAAVQGKINNSPEKSAELIENFMVGASTFDRGPAYYNRKGNKAVILWGERPGVRKAALAGYQVAALGTSTRCIVLSANAVPAANVVEQANGKGVPVISAPGDVAAVIGGVDSFMARMKFKQEKKIPKLLETLEQNLELGPLTYKINQAS